MQQQKLLGGISPKQYEWLKVRMGCGSDAEACRITSVSKDSLRQWKRNPAFADILVAVRSDQLTAFRKLSLSLTEAALSALEWLLLSPKGSDKKAGLEAWRQVFRIGAPEKQEDETLPSQIFNILNVRGDVDPRVLSMANPLKLAPAPKVTVEEVPE